MQLIYITLQKNYVAMLYDYVNMQNNYAACEIIMLTCNL